MRLIVVDKQKDPWGAYLENLGNYNPRTKEGTFNVERIKYWISKGASPSATVHNVLVTKGIIEAKKKRASYLTKKRKEKMAQEAKPAAPAA